MRPLEGLVVLDFAQFLAGPSAALRLADLGARVIKIERPGTGDGCRQLRLADLAMDEESLLFHTINRGKESLVVDLSAADDRDRLKALVARSDVFIHSFRPGAIDRYGFDFATLREVNPRLVYAHVTGYGPVGPWVNEPGQDLLVQARTGMAWLGGRADDPPTPLPLSVVDQVTGAYLVQGVLACLVRRGMTNTGGLVEVSLVEAAVDLQLEAFTAYLNGGGQPRRSAVSATHPYIDPPYGIYRTVDGWLAVAMGSLPKLGELVGAPDLADAGANGFADPAARDGLRRRLATVLETRTTAEWLAVLVPAGYWCAEVRSWPELEASGVPAAMDLIVECRDEAKPDADGRGFRTTRCPIRIDGQPVAESSVAPRLGEHKILP